MLPGNDRVHPGHRPQVVLGQRLVGVRGERGGERLDAVAGDRQAGGGAMAAEALEVRGARAEPGVQVEGRHRAP